MIALPTGDSFESLFSAGLASADPTMWYSNVCLAATSRRRTRDPIETAVLRNLLLGDHPRGKQAVLELDDLCAQHRLFVLGVVVTLRSRRYRRNSRATRNPLSDLAAFVATQMVDLLPKLLVSPQE